MHGHTEMKVIEKFTLKIDLTWKNYVQNGGKIQ